MLLSVLLIIAAPPHTPTSGHIFNGKQMKEVGDLDS
jgi:hypothetical protein